jgi:uncharacterized protein
MPQAIKAERRTLSTAQARVCVERREQQPARIEGYGAVFYNSADPRTEYQLYTDLFERIAPGAFDEALQAGSDVRSLFNHDSNWVLGRTISSPSTLALSVDAVGLKYSVTPPDTQAVRDQVLTPIGRGDIGGSSFMFWAKKVSWIQEDRDGRQVDIRVIEKVELLEVGPVTFPAYQSTTTGLRSAEGQETILAERDAARAARTAGKSEWDGHLVQVQLRQAQAIRDLEAFC